MSRSDEDSTGPEEAFMEIARFVVVKAKSSHSLCLRISTYGGQATTKPGINPADHAAVVQEGTTAARHSGENLVHEPIEVKIEDRDVSIHAMSRINFAKIYTVEHNIKVRNVGRVTSESLQEIERHFLKALGIPLLRPAPEPDPTNSEISSVLTPDTSPPFTPTEPFPPSNTLQLPEKSPLSVSPPQPGAEPLAIYD